jgi:hypothetical protein
VQTTTLDAVDLFHLGIAGNALDPHVPIVERPRMHAIAP